MVALYTYLKLCLGIDQCLLKEFAEQLTVNKPRL